MKGLYIILAAVFITLMISPATYSGYIGSNEETVFVIYEADNSSDADSSDEEPVEWDGMNQPTHVAECSYGGRTAPSTEKPEDPYTLGFVGGSFTPTERLDSRIQDKLSSAGADDYTYCFVMLSGRITDAKRDALTEHGVKLLGYHSHHSYAAKIPLNRIEEIGNLSFVRWIGYAPSDLKIHPLLREKLSSGNDDEIRVYISVFDSDLNENSEKIVPRCEAHSEGQYSKKQYHTYMYMSNGPFQNKLEEMGVTILFYDDGLKMFTACTTPGTINRIVDLDFVHFISSEPDPMMKRIAYCQGTKEIGPYHTRPPSSSYEVYVEEPSEQEENTTEDSNPGIVTIVRMAFAGLQRRLI